MGWAKPQLARRRQIIATLLEKFPDTGSRTLARMLHEKHPVIFDTLENARSAVRSYHGNMGSEKRKIAEKRGTARAPRKPGELPPLPKSEAKPWEPFVLDARRVLVLSDLHIPYHDEQAIEAALGYGDHFKPDAVLLNGDVFDFYQISRFDKDPTKPKIKHELKCGEQFFAHLRARYPDAQLVFKLGNHDERMDHYLQHRAAELFDIEEYRFAWHTAVGLAAYEITVVSDQRRVMLGKLTALHGHEKGKGISSPVNPARGSFLRMLINSLEGHGHRTSEHNERRANGENICCRTTGCLCGLWPDYAKVNKWDLGFATVEVDKDGGFECELKRIIEGRVR
jgi:predicted phosphodiesterase